MTSREASRQLNSFFPLFREAHRVAWSDVTTQRIHPEYDTRTCSAILHMHAVMEMRRIAVPGNNLAYLCIQSRHLFLAEPELAVFRLKQLDGSHLASNYPTPTSDKIYRQEGIPGLDGMPWLTVGIIANKDWTDYAGPFVTCPKDAEENNWVLNISGEGVATDINDLQTEFDEEVVEPRVRRFTPKRGVNGNESEGNAAGA